MMTQSQMIKLNQVAAFREKQEMTLNKTEIFAHIDKLLCSVTILIQESDKDISTLPIANILLESVSQFLRNTFHELPLESVQSFRQAIEDLQEEIFVIAKRIAA